jgi:adenylyltransferase/sulfurtransferase
LKVESARRTLLALNPGVQIETLPVTLDETQLRAQVGQSDLVIDASDNFVTRFAVNAACFASRTPLVSGAAIRLEGQVSVFLGQPGGPCYQCLYPAQGEEDQTCTANGVLAPLVGIVGSVQATEAIKLLAGIGVSLHGRLLLLDAMQMQWRSLKLKADPNCPICA